MQDAPEATRGPSGPASGVTGPVAELPMEELDFAIEAEANGYASAPQLALLAGHRQAWRDGLRQLLRDTEANLASVRNLTGPERNQVVADFERERANLAAALRRLEPSSAKASVDRAPDNRPLDGPGEVRLQASWSGGRIVLWAAGPGTAPASDDELDALLARVEAPSGGWWPHDPVPLPSNDRAPARAIGVGEALGWLVALGATERAEGVGTSLVWLGRVAVWGVRLVARGSIVPTLESVRSSRARREDASNLSAYSVRWAPALVDRAELDALARSVPGPVGALDRSDARALTLSVLGAVVDTIAGDAARRLDLAAPPPVVRTPADVAESVLTGLGGTPFEAPTRLAAALGDRLKRWAEPVRGLVEDRLIVQLDPPDRGGAWFLSVLGPGQDGRSVPLEVALVDGRSKRHLADETLRLERLLPVLNRPGGQRRGEVVLSQDEAFELMTVTGPALETSGFDVRVPALSRRRPRPALRMTAEPVDESVVGAHQLADVRWSAMFDDVELTAEDIRRLGAEARPLIHSRGRWVELDLVDLNEAAAALAERASRTRLTGAEVLRHAIGLEASPLAGGTSVGGSGWAADLLAKTAEVSTEAVVAPEGFVGALRSYQSEALAWLGFLDSAGLGGCLALDMGLGKTPTMLAHLARTPEARPTLVVAPPAVVGNWAAEAERFTPGLRVVVHHGSSRASADDLAAETADADVVITTYGTAVRDIDALVECPWARVVLDEAQTIKNPASEAAQQLRRIGAQSRIALTGTPVENGLGDLWSILDYTNPGLLGARSTFVTQLTAQSQDTTQRAEHALRALNGVLVFRRTKAEPAVAAELPDKIDELDHCTMTNEQVGLYQAVLDRLVGTGDDDRRPGDILAAITALKQICNHPAAYQDDGRPLVGRSGKLARLEEIVDSVFAAGEKILVFTHFAEWGKKLAEHLSTRAGMPIGCYHGGLSRDHRDRLIAEFQERDGPGALVLSLKAGGTGLNLTAASHVVLYDRWWNPAVEDQARDRAWRIGQQNTVVSHRLVCPGTVDERVEAVVAGKRHIADLVLPKSSTLSDLNPDQLRVALGLKPDSLLTAEAEDTSSSDQEAA
ncbi:MAG: DEAD/DEAH box helicase [Actinomycetota bacterium]|nr:DEAD/DEAH box helicase [Actinomycetota bacterium]